MVLNSTISFFQNFAQKLEKTTRMPNRENKNEQYLRNESKDSAIKDNITIEINRPLKKIGKKFVMASSKK